MTATYQPDLSIIIVSWNTRDLLTDCLNSLATGCGELTGETWVVDNASSDGSAEMVRASFPQVRLIANAHNVGFAAANNQAIPQACGRYVMLLNPDTEVHLGALETLVRYADSHPTVGVLGPRLVNADGSHQRSCWRGYPGLTMALTDALYLWKLSWLPLAQATEYRPEELRQPREVDHLLGACLMARQDVFAQVGLLDEDYFIFLEETDWCWRAQQAGWPIVYHPGATVTHYGQRSTRQQPARNLTYLYQSYCHFYRKRHPHGAMNIIALKATIALAAVIRMGLWLARAGLTRQHDERVKCQTMITGYRQVLRALPSL